MDKAGPDSVDRTVKKFQFGLGVAVAEKRVMGHLAVAAGQAHCRFGGKRVREELAYLYSPGSGEGCFIAIDISTEVGRAVAESFELGLTEAFGEDSFDVGIPGCGHR